MELVGIVMLASASGFTFGWISLIIYDLFYLTPAKKALKAEYEKARQSILDNVQFVYDQSTSTLIDKKDLN